MEPPVKPCESDCCGSGCNPCILDVYEEQLQKYLNNLKEYQEEISRSYLNCICTSSYSVFKLVGLEKHTENSYIYKFEYHSNEEDYHEKKLRFNPGQHFLLKARESSSGEVYTRAYTPIPYEENDKLFTILARLYDNGKMSAFLGNLKVGDETFWRGPYGNFIIDFTSKNILFIAQGTGIAPLFAVIKTMLQNDFCETFLHLFFCCKNINEIFLRSELHELKAHWNFTYEIFLKDSTNVSLKYQEIIHGRKLQEKDIEQFIKKKNDLKVIICGSDEFENNIFDCTLKYGIQKRDIFMF